MAEVPGEAELDFYQRGYNSQLRTLNDQPMESRFQGNIIELCPCGALTSETYRFRARPHDLDHADSVCAQCPVGCNLILDTRANAMARVRGRQNEQVNEIWLCDKGRFAYHYVSAEDRLAQPMLKTEDGTYRPASWPEAIGSAAVQLQRIKDTHGPRSIGVIGGRNLTNEDCYALARFAREVLETPNVDHRIGARTPVANPLAAHGLAAFNSAYPDVERAGAIVLLGTDVYEEMPVFWLRIRKGVRNGAKLVIANPRATEADRIAFHRLRHRPGTELALLRGLAAALVEAPPMDEVPAPPPAEGQPAQSPEQRPRDLSALRDALGGATVDQAADATGVTAQTLRAAAASLGGAKNVLIYVGARLAIRADAADLAAALVGLSGALGNAGAVNYFTEGANGRGAEFAGLVPGDGGLPAGEIIAQAAAGQIKALYLAGENVLATHPDRQQALQALANAELVVVHELFATETAQQADVVFPATSFAEKDGTLTNAEGRIQRLHYAVRTPFPARPDWRILSDLSGEMGAALGYAAAQEITRDLLADLDVYSTVQDGTIPSEGVLTKPLPVGEAARSAGEGMAANQPAQAGAASEGTGELTLITYSELVGDETMVRPTVELMETVPLPYVEVNRADAQRLGLEAGQVVDVKTDRGSVQRQVRVNTRCPQGVCFAPDNLGHPRINEILDWSATATAVQLTPLPAPAAAPAAAGAGA
jgi:predicted molibdopterin-dependent oxidoreductase YjgC